MSALISTLFLGLALSLGPAEPTSKPEPQPGLLSRASLAFGSAILLSAIADVETTLHCTTSTTRSVYCSEMSLWAPMADRRPALYGLKLAVGTGMWTLSARLRQSENRWLRLAGWLVPLELIAIQSWAAAHNWRVLSRLPR